MTVDAHPDELRSAPAGPRSGTERVVRAFLAVPDAPRRLDETTTSRLFGVSILASALRCVLSYLILPIVLPLVGLTRGWGPAIALPIGILALVFDWMGARRFWMADHPRKWSFTVLYGVVGTMVFCLVVADLVTLLR